MTLLDELKEHGYEVTEEIDKTIGLHRHQYLDNGYGFYFTSDIDLVYDKEKQEITEVLVDGYDEKQIEELLQKETDKCPIMKRFNECVENLFGEESEEAEKMIENGEVDCNDCMYLSMIELLMMYINDGNW